MSDVVPTTAIGREHSSDSARSLIVSVALAFLLFYSPFFFGPRNAFVTVHDNLDSDAAYNFVSGIFYLHPAEAKHLLLNGNLPVYLVHCLFWPISLLNLLPNAFLAYALNDVLVRAVAFLGMFLLSLRIGASRLAATLAGFVFAFSLALPALGFTVAGIPAVVFLVDLGARQRLRWFHYLVLLLLGWDSSLVLSGAFVLVLLPLILGMLFDVRGWRGWRVPYFFYAAGLLLGAAGIIYGLLAGPEFDRQDWVLSGVGALESFRMFLRNQFSPRSWDFYHVSTPLALLYISLLVSVAVTRSKRVLPVVGLVVFINAFFAFVQSAPVADLRNHVGGLVKTFQFDRFYFLDSFAIVVAWVLAWVAAGQRMRRLLICAIGAQMLATLALSIQFRSPISRYFGRKTVPTFSEHNMPDDYKLIRSLIGETPTISVGLDPMSALANRISVLDGYWSAYPLSYKARFRHIIARQLERDGPYSDNWGSGLTTQHVRAYFDTYGSRLYTFVSDPSNVELDYCAASQLGAGYVISRFPLQGPNLNLVLVTKPSGLGLYSIRDCR